MLERFKQRKLVYVLVAVMALGTLSVTPAGAHFKEKTQHLARHAWKDFIKQRTTKRHYTKNKADNRFVNNGEANSVDGSMVVDNSLTGADALERTFNIPHAWGNVEDTVGGDPTAPDNFGIIAVNDGPLHVPGVFCFKLGFGVPDLILVTLSNNTPDPEDTVLTQIPGPGGTTTTCGTTTDAFITATDGAGNLKDDVEFSVAFFSFT